jgi:uncharacterized membrane protein YraQ (UPF0718 family)
MYYLYIITGIALIVSLVVSREKTLRAVKMAVRRFVNILPVFIVMLVLVSVVLYLVPNESIRTYLGIENKYLAVFLASVIGSAILMPGFIAFPLAGVLLAEGVPYMVLSAFTTTLMMVGVLSFPVERAYLGAKVAVVRNLISFFIALVIAVITGIFFGEVFS